MVLCCTTVQCTDTEDYGPLLLELEECGGGADEYLGLAEGDIGQQLPVLQQHLDTHHHHHQTKVRKP